MKKFFVLIALTVICSLLFGGCEFASASLSLSALIDQEQSSQADINDSVDNSDSTSSTNESKPDTEQSSQTKADDSDLSSSTNESKLDTEQSSQTNVDDSDTSDIDTKYEYKFGVEEMTVPFWQSDIVYNECVVFHKNIETGEISANTLFKPIQIVAFKDNSLTIDLIEGIHYKRDEKDPYKLVWLEGDDDFVIPYFVPDDLNGVNEHGDDCYVVKFGDCTHCVGPYLYTKQLAITYTYDHEESDDAPHAEYSEDLLKNTIDILKNEDSINICIYGDSIFTGCESSSLYKRQPNIPTFFELLEQQLEIFYPNCDVKMTNSSVGGWGAQDGVDNVHDLVSVKDPDLVIIGFGMNDSLTKGTDEATKVQLIIDDIKETNPDCEFIIVSTFHANPQVGWDIEQKTHYAGFQTLETEGIACMDMYNLHTYLLDHKTFQSTTGNNINHPNDYFARMYASQLLSMLYDYNVE